MALLSATDSWLDAIDKGSYVGALLIDLSKAFDTVITYVYSQNL